MLVLIFMVFLLCVPFGNGALIEDGTQIGKGATIGDGATIGALAILGNNVTVAPLGVVGPGSVIPNGASVP